MRRPSLLTGRRSRPDVAGPVSEPLADLLVAFGPFTAAGACLYLGERSLLPARLEGLAQTAS